MDIQVLDMYYGILERGKMYGVKFSLINVVEIQVLEGIIVIVFFEYVIGIVVIILEKVLVVKIKLVIDWD